MTTHSTETPELAIKDMPFTPTTLRRVVGTPTIPSRWKSEGDAMAGVLYGRELGLMPMTSLQLLHIINGRVGMEGKALLALIQSRGHLVIPVEMSAERVRLKAMRRMPDGAMMEVGEFEFTWEDAERAGLSESDTYQLYPIDMLYWRAVSRVAKFAFSDVTTGLLLPEEIGATVEVEDVEAAHALVEAILDAEEVQDMGLTHEDAYGE